MFNIIKKLDGKAGSKIPGTPLKRGNRFMRTDESKADVFSKEYSKVSDIPITCTKDKKRKIRRENKKNRLEDDEA